MIMTFLALIIVSGWLLTSIYLVPNAIKRQAFANQAKRDLLPTHVKHLFDQERNTTMVLAGVKTLLWPLAPIKLFIKRFIAKVDEWEKQGTSKYQLTLTPTSTNMDWLKIKYLHPNKLPVRAHVMLSRILEHYKLLMASQVPSHITRGEAVEHIDRINRLMTQYLPDTLDAYLAISTPSDHDVDMLSGQLDTILLQLTVETTKAVSESRDQLQIQGQFLKSKFPESELSI